MVFGDSPIIRKEVHSMIEVKKKDNESLDHLLRRFSKMAMSSVIRPIKSSQYFSRPQNRNAKKKSAVHRARTAARLDWLDRVGKLDEYLERSRSSKRGRGRR